MKKKLQLIVLFSLVLASITISQNRPVETKSTQSILAKKSLDLDNRQPDRYVNDVFKDNILLSLAYMKGFPPHARFSWDIVRKASTYQFVLKPKETFAFHEDILPEFSGNVVKTTNAHFNYQEGFKSDGYLFGDGICHFASLLNWVATDAELNVIAPTNHDFSYIPDIPKQYGVSIYSHPNQPHTNALQNLLITNNRDVPIVFTFHYKDDILTVTISKI